MEPFSYKLLFARLLTEFILVAGAMLVLFLDQARAKSWASGKRCGVAAGLSAGIILLSMIAACCASDFGAHYGGMVVISPMVQGVKICLLALAAASILIASPARFTPHIGEYCALLLLAAAGLLLLAGTEELLTAFVSLELASLSLYALTAFHKRNIKSVEAALKYFLFGSVAAAFTLYGISLVYGLAGSTAFADIASALAKADSSPLLLLALVLASIGFGFKLAAAPLHLWAPDAYQGAPIPSAALIASGSKLASLFLFLKFFAFAVPGQSGSAGYGQAAPGWMVIIAALAAVSMILGNLLALAQSNVRRLIAYSAIAHAGYALVAVLAASEAGLAAAVYYLFTYGLAVIGIFGVIGLVEVEHGELTVDGLAGLGQRSPLLAGCLAVFVLSLAGIPPLAGFFGKFYVFLAALDATRSGAAPGLLWIVVLAIAASAVSLYYYLKILKQCFVADSGSTDQICIPFHPRWVIPALALGVLLLGCFPNLLLSRLAP